MVPRRPCRFARGRAHGGPKGWLIALDNEADASWATTTAWVARWNQLTGGHPGYRQLVVEASGLEQREPNPLSLALPVCPGTGAGAELFSRVPASWWTPGYGGWGSATEFSSSATVAGHTVDVDAFREVLISYAR